MTRHVRIDPREQERDECGEDGSPQREEDQPDTAHHAAAHRLGSDARANDRQSVQRARDEQDRCPLRSADVLVCEVEPFLDVDRSAELREPHDFR